jgi:DNA (cytosine-5)-methyltransferase 1
VTFFDSFAGVGGFALALNALGHECVGFSEIDKAASSVYRYNFPTHTPYGDITKIDAASLPDFDLFVGGFPCQSHSVAGKRGGLSDKRGELFWDVVRIVAAKKPQWFILENVAGLLSSDGGRAMGTILGALADLGYGVAYRVLDAKHFGVPQRRRRVFFVGHLGDERAGEVLALTEGMPGNLAQSGQARESPATNAPRSTGTRSVVSFDENRTAHEDEFGTLQARREGGGFEGGVAISSNDVRLVSGDNAHTLTAHCAKGGDPTTDNYVVCPTGDVTHALRAKGSDASEDGTGRGTPITAFSSKAHGADAADTCPTLRAMNFDTSHLNGGGHVAVAFNVRGRKGGAQAEADPAGMANIRAAGGGSSRTMVAFNARQDTDSWAERTGPLDTDGTTQAIALSENQRAEVVETSSTPSLNGAGGKPGQGYAAIRSNSVVRRLTPTECERLMSWPDGWTKYGRLDDGTIKQMADSPRYKMCGNGVVSSVVHAIAERIGQRALT